MQEICVFLFLLFFLFLILIFVSKTIEPKPVPFLYETPVHIVFGVKDSENTIEYFLRTLSWQIKNAHSQTFMQPEELIVVDLGSSDKTFEIIQRLSHEYPFIHPMTLGEYKSFLNQH
ncbi:MAG: hypothetical protein IJW15_05595 [Clostridia bacterium]|nr:hypothetical protein [Clostridia bacterium]